MATAYYTPGVYIEEVDKGTKPIQGVSTSVTAFIGFTAKAEKVQEDGITTRSILGEPTLVTNWGQFERMFGSYHRDAYLPYAVRGFFDNGGTRCYVISIRAMDAHRAQVVVYGEDKRSGRKTPVLLVRAAAAGPDGDAISVSVQPVGQVGEDPMTDKQKLKQPFRLTVHGAPAAAEASPASPEDKRRTDLRRKVNDLKAQVDAATQEAAQIQEELNKEQAADKQAELKKKLEEAAKKQAGLKEKLDTAQKELNAAESAGALEFTLEDLPFVEDERALRRAFETYERMHKPNNRNGSGSERPNGADKPKPGSFFDQRTRKLPVEVWKLNKQGREAAIWPSPTEQPAKLAGGAWQFDFELLSVLRESEPLDTITQATDQAALVIGNATLLHQGGEPQRKGFDGLFAFDEVNMVCAPDLMKAYEVLGTEKAKIAEADTIVKSVQESILTFCRKAHYPFAILDAPSRFNVQEVAEWRMNLPGGDTPHGALYYPWIKIADPFDARRQIEIPPCGHIAGIYARSDSQRGVHKAPANELVGGAVDLRLNVTKNEQELLNPIGVNCIRAFPGRGIRVWGARTLSMTDPAWRYINVRRLFSYVEASIERSTQWVVFEPNDHVLWAKVRRDVSAFLRTVWLSGALFGQTPEEAYYVKCDAETNSPELRDLGQMVCEIGMAPVKPAEFVIFRFSQWTSDADTAA
jgi:phage tail sheath protein FI